MMSELETTRMLARMLNIKLNDTVGNDGYILEDGVITSVAAFKNKLRLNVVYRKRKYIKEMLSEHSLLESLEHLFAKHHATNITKFNKLKIDTGVKSKSKVFFIYKDHCRIGAIVSINDGITVTNSFIKSSTADKYIDKLIGWNMHYVCHDVMLKD